MKKILLFAAFFILSFASYSQNNRFHTVDSLKTYILKYIRNSTLESFTNYRMQNVVYGTVEILDSLTANAGTTGIDSIWLSSSATKDSIKFRKDGVNYTAAVLDKANQRLLITDTTTMLSPYLRSNIAAVTYQPIGSYLTPSDTLNKWIGLGWLNTLSSKQNALTLTTTGTSGAATLVGSTLNIPQYSGGGGSSTSNRVWNVVDFGADTTFTNDATNQIQAAINACFNAGGGVVYFPKGHYKIAGSLVISYPGTIYSPNSQLYIPLQSFSGSDTLKHIKLLGEVPPNIYSEPLTNHNRPTSGVLLESTTRHTGSVIGSPGEYVSWGVFNYADVTFENLTIRVATDSSGVQVGPKSTAIDGSYLSMMSVNNCAIDIKNQYNSVQPFTSAYGIKTPPVNNFVKNNISNTLITGYWVGATINEHSVLNDVFIDACYYGIELKTANHTSHVDKTVIARCKRPILVSGDHLINADNISIEWKTTAITPTSAWFNTDYAIYFSSGTLRGNINYAIIESGVGLNNAKFNTNSPSSLKTTIFPIGSGHATGGEVMQIFSGEQTYNQIVLDATKTGGGGQAAFQFRKNGTAKWDVGSDFAANGTSDFYWYDRTNSKAKFYFATNGDIKMGGDAYSAPPVTVKNGGNVLIGTTTDNGAMLNVNGTGSFSNILSTSGRWSSISNKTANYTLVQTDETITADCTSGNVTLTLPTAVGRTGQVFTLKRTDNSGNTMTVATTSSQTIDGSTTYSLSAQYKYVTVQSNGSNWIVIANN